MNVEMTRALVKNILKNYTCFAWSLQGFGMLRCYLDATRVHRIHIWDPRYRIPGVSDIHTHPWDFRSTVLSGDMLEEVFTMQSVGSGEPFKRLKIQTGEQAHGVEEPENVFLYRSQHRYPQGEHYRHKRDDIHRTLADAGTVTIVERDFFDDTEHAYSFYQEKFEWVDAKPRPANIDEAKDIVETALKLWKD